MDTCHFKKSFLVELEAAAVCEELLTEEVEVNCIVDVGMEYEYEVAAEHSVEAEDLIELWQSGTSLTSMVIIRFQRKLLKSKC